MNEREGSIADVSSTSKAGVSPPGQRRRIWQINASMHCSVVGTCLSVHDLHIIARRAGRKLDSNMSSYALHSWFVDMMCYANEISKLVDKALEKQHETPARAVRRARTEEELEARWGEVAARGHIASAYWCAMSHPLCSERLQWRLFGEIHMLSHLVGSSRRSDLARLHELEGTCAAADSKLAQLKHDHRAVLKERKRLEDELDGKGRELERTKQRLVIAHDRIEMLESQSLAGQLQAHVRALELRLDEAVTRASATESALSDVTARLELARSASELAAAQVSELSKENEALETELASLLRSTVADDKACTAPCSLGGKRILCVGGRCNLVPHYRQLVERRGGELLHHDGGLEESPESVTRALATIDAVFCPVDCVSHAAYLNVKKACKHLGKRLVLLRTSGLSSFARAVEVIASAEVAPVAEP